MTHKNRWYMRAALAGVAFLLLAGGLLWWALRPAKPVFAHLVKTDFSRLAAWEDTDPQAALAAFRASCGDILKRPDGALGGAGYAGTVADWRAVCRKAAGVKKADARRFFTENFVPFVVVPPAGQDGLFTGYYAPQIEVRETPDKTFSAPVYGPPEDLVQADLGDFRDDLKGRRIAGRVRAGLLEPYASRADIVKNGLKNAPVLAYADPVDLFFLQIQGSGVARFADGHTVRLQYAAQNGWPYTAIGRVLIKNGAIPKDKMSMQAIHDWLKRHPDQAASVMNANASYVFFTSQPVDPVHMDPPGAEHVPLTAGASVAVDSTLHAFGVPCFITTRDGTDQPVNGLFIAQDIGGAIRGAVRADIYFGIGETAEARAGAMASKGQMYVLLPDTLAASLPDRIRLSGAEK